MGEKKRRTDAGPTLVPLTDKKSIAIHIQAYFNPTMQKHELMLQMGGFKTQKDSEAAAKTLIDFVESEFGSEQISPVRAQ